MNKQQPSLRARIRSAQWMERTKRGQSETAEDRAARVEFENELPLLPTSVQQAVSQLTNITLGGSPHN